MHRGKPCSCSSGRKQLSFQKNKETIMRHKSLPSPHLPTKQGLGEEKHTIYPSTFLTRSQLLISAKHHLAQRTTMKTCWTSTLKYWALKCCCIWSFFGEMHSWLTLSNKLFKTSVLSCCNASSKKTLLCSICFMQRLTGSLHLHFLDLFNSFQVSVLNVCQSLYFWIYDRCLYFLKFSNSDYIKMCIVICLQRKNRMLFQANMFFQPTSSISILTKLYSPQYIKKKSFNSDLHTQFPIVSQPTEIKLWKPLIKSKQLRLGAIQLIGQWSAEKLFQYRREYVELFEIRQLYT